MYNRYVPQPDGTYKRKSLQESADHPRNEQPHTEEHDPSEPVTEKKSPPERARCSGQRNKRPLLRQRPEKSAASFLKELLPRDLDTSDLLIVILLLLISADGSGEDQGNAILTLALYLFM